MKVLFFKSVTDTCFPRSTVLYEFLSVKVLNTASMLNVFRLMDTLK